MASFVQADEADGLQQQKNMLGSTSVSQEQKAEATVFTGSPNWTSEDWKYIAWSDKSRFLLRLIDGKVRIWHQQHWTQSALCQ